MVFLSEIAPKAEIDGIAGSTRMTRNGNSVGMNLPKVRLWLCQFVQVRAGCLPVSTLNGFEGRGSRFSRLIRSTSPRIARTVCHRRIDHGC